MTIKIGVVMDPIESIHYKKDTTLAMLWEAERLGWMIYYIEPRHLFVKDGKAFANAELLHVFHDPKCWFAKETTDTLELTELNVILLRKDPPFTVEYIYTTHILEIAERAGVLVINKPQSLRDCNEKLFTTWFPHCCPRTLVTRDIKLLKHFLQEQQDIVCKPLDAMGGESIFRLKYPDMNASVVFETLTLRETRFTMAQQFIPAISEGDKRVLMIDGEPIPYALARIPAPGELRGNLAAGGHGIAQSLTPKDQWICEQVGPLLREKGLLFVGIDIIGDYLTEINVTSPTCVRELDEQCNLNICQHFFSIISKKILPS
ncbi:MAG: glutathione synthase [Gammaproteobacteria bacterium]|nr:glutathione synthase [Gammaproteobacteria bacterium]